ncbi:DUF3159 domain-containing protein [Saccharopolyspora erythraea]|uniref:DUF3159 domain-containing protein n=1 Tax=Saccharopolyspora erythraea TaxID=1836 RepID=UPI001BAD1DC3|nr:DUF3159 domain-containing protein [Saccharopolyspora erythraea]QUH01326.1 DUF3159 domain-containing protein [Saccharopolyspora erythraea]
MSDSNASAASGGHRPAGAEPADTTGPAPGPSEDRVQDAEKTMLEQMGGVSGLAYSAVPIVVFVVISTLASLMVAIWSAIGVAVAIAVVRLVRKEPLQPAISGVIGVAVCSFIAYRSGEAKGFFLLGIWTSLVYGGVFLVSIVARWPLVGVVWSALNGLGFSWRRNRRAMLGYDLATLAWTVVFAAKFVVQQWLYVSDETGWLAFARIAMGYPLTGLALIVTVWAVRRASKIAEETAEAERADPALRSNPASS